MSVEVLPNDTDPIAETLGTDEVMPESDFLEDIAERIELFEYGSGKSALEYENRTGRALAAPDDTDMLKVEAYLDNMHDSGERDEDGNAVEYTTPDGRTRLSAHEYDLLKKVSESHFESLDNGGAGYVVGSYRANEQRMSAGKNDKAEADAKNAAAVVESDADAATASAGRGQTSHGKADRRKFKSKASASAVEERATDQPSESEGGNKPDGQKAEDKASDEKASKTNAESADKQADKASVPTVERVKTRAQRKKAENRARRAAERAAADESRTLDEDNVLPQMPEAASEDPVLNAEDADGGDGTYQMDGTAGANAVVNIGFRTLKPGGNRDEPKDWVYEDGFVLQPKPVRTPEAGPEKAATDEASEPGERQVPLSRYERLKNIAKSAGKAVVESGVFNRDVDERANRRISKERSADEAESPVNISQRIRERTSDLLNRAKYGALPTALALSEKVANMYGSQREQFTPADGSGRTDKLTDLFRKRGENGELGEISTGKVVAAAAGVLALYTASRFLGELPSGMGGGANLNHAPDALNNMKAGGAGNDIYNPYAGGSVGRGGISTEAAAPQGGGRLVNHPNVGDIVPDAVPGAPKFNDEQLSNYATLHAGQRVDTASEALQDMFRKNGVAANREQFNTLLQDALKYDADVHQFTEGKTYDPTSMPDGYRFYLMNMDDIMRRLDELK